MKSVLKSIAMWVLPAPALHWLRARVRGKAYNPPVGWTRFGNLRRVTPISKVWGFDRGTVIDRYYIEQFLSEHASDVRGHVLEIANDTYTFQFGGNRVTKSDVLHVSDASPKVTIVADLTSADQIPSNTFDCIIFTQTLHFIYDLRAVIRTLYRILKPGGTLLVTCPGISKISRADMDRWGDYWRFTSLSSKKLFEEVFPRGQVMVKTYGNVLTSIAFLHGLAAEELSPEELNAHDQNFELQIGVKAVKPAQGA